MTDTLSQAEKSAYVLLKLGWDTTCTGNVISPDGRITFRSNMPDLYADTPEGALARERAEEVLERGHGFRIATELTGRNQWRGGYNDEYTFYHLVGLAKTRHEARAGAIHAAFRALEEGK